MADGRLPFSQVAPRPTVPLSILTLHSVSRSTARVPNIGHFRAILGSQKGVLGLLNGSLGLSVTVGLGKKAL